MAEDKLASASLQVTFVAELEQGAEQAALLLELDQAAHLLAYGEERTAFTYGEAVYFRVYAYPATLQVTLTLSDGQLLNVAGQGLGLAAAGREQAAEAVCFVNTNQAKTAKPVRDGSLTLARWLGNSLGALAAQGQLLTSASSGVAVASVAYTADFTRHAFRLGSRAEAEYPVVVHVYGALS